MTDKEAEGALVTADTTRRADRALALLTHMLACGIAPASPADVEGLGRDCVRAIRAIEAEAAEATPRPAAAPARPRPVRPAGPEAGLDLDIGMGDPEGEEERW